MPVIRAIPADPPESVFVQGEQLREAAQRTAVALVGGLPLLPQGIFDCTVLPLIAGEQNPIPMNDFAYASPPLRNGDDPFIGANGVICNSCGEITRVFGVRTLIREFVQSTARFVLIGVTRDSAGAVLGTCDVTVLEFGRMNKDGTPVVCQTISDGSGNYTAYVPMNVAYQVLAYKDGGTPVTGASLRTLTPSQV